MLVVKQVETHRPVGRSGSGREMCPLSNAYGVLVQNMWHRVQHASRVFTDVRVCAESRVDEIV
jgi:hypothetical protein